MSLIVKLSVLLVAGLHVLFMILEMLLWNTPAGRRIFGLTRELAQQTAVLAANQGLYNGFLAAGLAWGLLAGVDGVHIRIFCLACVVTAGVFGAITVRHTILWIQAAPGAIALALVFLSGKPVV